MKKEEFNKSPLNNDMLNYNVYVMNSGEKFLVRLVLFLVGGCVGLIFYCNLFMVDGYATLYTYISNIFFFTIVGFFAIKFIEPIYINNKLVNRKNSIKIQFKDMLEAISTSISTGSNVDNAFEMALTDLKVQYSEKDYIVVELQEIIDGMSQNISVDVMLRDFAKRTGNDDIDSFADVFEICYKKGGNMIVVINRTKNLISEKMEIADEIETKITSNKMQHNIMSIMPIAVVAMLRLTNKSFASNFATLSGVIVNTLAIIVFVAAYKYGLKIIDIKG